jgi:hypothetical protein
MLTLILRSVCVGIATVVAAILLGVFVGLPVATMVLANSNGPSGSGEIGWDLVSIAQNYRATSILSPLIVFGIGFGFAYRYFSKLPAKK